MRKGKVIVGALSHKNRNHIFKEYEPITENDVDNWDELVKGKYIQPDKETIAAEEKAKKEAEAKAKKEAKEKEEVEAKAKEEAEEKAKKEAEAKASKGVEQK